MPVCVYVFPFSEILCFLVCSVVVVVSDISFWSIFITVHLYSSCFCLYFSLVYITFHSVVFIFCLFPVSLQVLPSPRWLYCLIRAESIKSLKTWRPFLVINNYLILSLYLWFPLLHFSLAWFIYLPWISRDKSERFRGLKPD